MKEVFLVATVNADLTLSLVDGVEHETYPAAAASISALPAGRYQVQKFFVVS